MPEKSHRKRFDELLRNNPFLEQIFNAILDGILILDREGVVSFANGSAEEILGIPREKLLKMRGDEIPVDIHTREGEKIREESQPMSKALGHFGTPESQQVILKRPDGKTTPVLFNISGTPDGQVVAILTEVSDLTRKQRQMEDYFRFVAHDLRAPLTVTLGHSDLLQSEVREGSRGRRSLDAIQESGRQMLEMIDGITDQMRIESGNFTLNKNEVDLSRLIHELADHLSTGDWTHPIEIETEESLYAPVDASLLKRALTNLLTNARKYSPKRSRVVLKAWSSRKGIIITVSDQGLGIDPQDQPYVFDPFYITSIGKQKKGLGLGLYIASQIVEAHGGRVYLSSTPEGTTFAINLPS